MNNPVQKTGQRDGYVGIVAFTASDAALLGRSTNGFSDIGCRMAGTLRNAVRRFDGQRHRIGPGADSDAPEPMRRKRTL